MSLYRLLGGVRSTSSILGSRHLSHSLLRPVGLAGRSGSRSYVFSSFFSATKSTSTTENKTEGTASEGNPEKETSSASNNGTENGSTANASANEVIINRAEYETLKKGAAEKDAKIRELLDAYKLSLADMENLRTRTKKEVENASNFAIQKFSKDLLDVADVLEMAMSSVPEEHRHDKNNPYLRDLFTGLDATRAELNTIFRRHGVELFDPIDQAFDPNFHNAQFQVPMTDKKPGTVVAVQKKGYTLKGRVLRPADVGVSREP